mmetsp:Transcript_70617/g.216406  ORF Transcript_70617/g.216406 Transcript_70617/m.216406 type:complete len:960 (-) Transcript_70617:541-3420(-)
MALAALDGLPQQVIVRAPGPHLGLVRHQVPEPLVIHDARENLGLQLRAVDARVHPVGTQPLEAVFNQCLAEVLRGLGLLAHPAALPRAVDVDGSRRPVVVARREGLALVVVAEPVIPLVLPEGRPVRLRAALGGAGLPGDALDQHTDCHARREAVRVEEDVRGNTAVREGHVLLRPQEAHDALLAVPGRELVADHGVPRVAEPHHHALVPRASLDLGAVHQGHVLHVARLVVLVLGQVRLVVGVHIAIHRGVLGQEGPDLRQARRVELRDLQGVREVALRRLVLLQALGRGVDDLGFVDHAVAEAPLVGRLVDDHRVLHVVACVRDHCDHGVGPSGVQVAAHRIVGLGSHHRLLGVQDPEHLVVGPVLVVVVRRPHGLLQHLALVHVPRTLVVVRERRQRREDREDPGRRDLLVAVMYGELLWDAFHRAAAAAALRAAGGQDGVGLLALGRQRRDVNEDLLQRTDELLPARRQAAHRPHQPPLADEEVEAREQLPPSARDAHDLQVRRHAPGPAGAELGVAERPLGVPEERRLQGAHRPAVQEDPEVLAPGGHPREDLPAGLPDDGADALEDLGDGGPRAVVRPARDDAALRREVVQEAARGAVGGVHGAKEPPGLREQLPDGRGLHLGEVLPAVDRREVRAEPRLVELIGHDGVPGRLHQIQAAAGIQVARGDEAVQPLRHVRRHLDHLRQEPGHVDEVLWNVLRLLLALLLVDPLPDDHAHAPESHLQGLLEHHAVELPRRQRVVAAHGVLVVPLDVAPHECQQLLIHDAQREQLLPTVFGVDHEEALHDVGADLLVARALRHVPAQDDSEGAAEEISGVALGRQRPLGALLLQHHQQALPELLVGPGGVGPISRAAAASSAASHQFAQHPVANWETALRSQHQRDQPLLPRVGKAQEARPIGAVVQRVGLRRAVRPHAPHDDRVLGVQVAPVLVGGPHHGHGVVGARHDEHADHPL